MKRQTFARCRGCGRTVPVERQRCVWCAQKRHAAMAGWLELAMLAGPVALFALAALATLGGAQ